VFLVKTDDNDDGPGLVLLAAGLPLIDDLHPEDSLAKVNSKSAAQVSSDPRVWNVSDPRVWNVTVSYASDESNSSGTGSSDDPDPEARPAVIEWSFAQFQRVADKDLNGTPIVNSAFDQFDPPPLRDDSRPVLRITRIEAGFDPARALDFQDTVNADNFFGANPGQSKCASIGARSFFENDRQWFEVVYEFHFRRDGFQLSILDQGYRQIELDGGSTINVAILEEVREGSNPTDRRPISSPAPLNGAGVALDKPAPGTTPLPTAFTYLDFVIYEERNFADLGLP
jgi:hypothetical protein